ncbi:unnamed protein product, partial [Heterotrigona itama]
KDIKVTMNKVMFTNVIAFNKQVMLKTLLKSLLKTSHENTKVSIKFLHTQKLEELEEGKHPYQEKEPLKSFPNNTNPETGEVGGPRGPEPTRYGDWERKGQIPPRERFVDLVLVETDPNNGELITNSEKDPTKWGDWQNGGRVSDF